KNRARSPCHARDPRCPRRRKVSAGGDQFQLISLDLCCLRLTCATQLYRTPRRRGLSCTDSYGFYARGARTEYFACAPARSIVRYTCTYYIHTTYIHTYARTHIDTRALDRSHNHNPTFVFGVQSEVV
ncbi:hypothetical protein DBV15_01841, partial [Temnothorax longispinosus]